MPECSNFFERHQSDRKKRTFEILSKFNPALAVEVVYKHNLHPSTYNDLEFSKADQNREALKLEQAAIKIQKTVKGFLARLKY